MLSDLKDTVRLLEVVGIPQGGSLILIFRLNDHVLDPTELDHISRLLMTIKLLSG